MFRSSSIYSSLNDKLGSSSSRASATASTTPAIASSTPSTRKESFLNSLRRKSARPLSYSVSTNNLNQQYNERLMSRPLQLTKSQQKHTPVQVVEDHEEKENLVPTRSKTLRTRLSAPNLHATPNSKSMRRLSMYFPPSSNLNFAAASVVTEGVTYESPDEEWTGAQSVNTTPMTVDSRDTLMDSVLQSEDQITISDEEIPDATGKPTLLSHTKIPKSYDFFRLPRSSNIQNLTLLNPLVTESCLELERLAMENFNYQYSDESFGLNVSLVGQNSSTVVMTVTHPNNCRTLGWDLIYNYDYDDMFREDYYVAEELVC